MTSTATSAPVSPGRLNPFHSGQHHFYHRDGHHHHHLYSPILNKKRINSPIRVDELDFLSHSSLSLIEESDCVLLDLFKSNSNFVTSSPAKKPIYLSNVNIPHPTNPPSPPIAMPGDHSSPDQSLLSSSSNTSSIPLSPIDEEEPEVELPSHEVKNEKKQPPRSPPQQVPAAKYDATLPKKSPTRSLLSSFTPSVEIVIEDTSQMIQTVTVKKKKKMKRKNNHLYWNCIVIAFAFFLLT